MKQFRIECLDASGSVYWTNHRDTLSQAVDAANAITPLGTIRIIEITTTETEKMVQEISE